MTRKTRRTKPLVVFAVLGAAAPAYAQTYGPTGPSAAQAIGGSFLDSEVPFDVSRGQNTGVLERPRPEYEAIGIRRGSFLIYPQLRLGVGYSSNVYGVPTNKVDDAFFTIDPNVHVESDWSRNAIYLDAGGALRRFADQTLKNEDGYHANLGGTLNVGDSTIDASAKIRRTYEAQYSGSFVINGIESVPITTKTGQVTGTYQGARFRVIGSADVNRVTFRNSLATDGSVIEQSLRDDTVVRGTGRLEYAATPTASAFVQATYSNSDYDAARSIGGAANRNGHETRVLAGATFDLSKLVRGSIGVGYVARTYDSALYPTVKGLTFDARIEYFMTELTNITLTANRIVEDSVSLNSGGYFETTYNARIDHELLRNVLLNLGATYQRLNFDNITRRDQTYQVQGGANYFLNRWMGLSGTLGYSKRTSRGVLQDIDFDEIRANATVTLQI